jgi:hypothetical protein
MLNSSAAMKDASANETTIRPRSDPSRRRGRMRNVRSEESSSACDIACTDIAPGVLPGILAGVFVVAVAGAVPLTVYSMTEPARAKGEHGSAPVRMK